MTNCHLDSSMKKLASTDSSLESYNNFDYFDHVSHIDNINNGLITKIWGSPGWIFNHSVTFGYPIEPTNENKKEYREYFVSVGNVLPCRYCRESYKKFITEGPTVLTDEVFKNRGTLTKWFYDIHEAVNHKLGVDYGMTYEDVIDRYESFRAKCNKNVTNIIPGCVTPLDYKAFSYRKLYQMDCPIISLNAAKVFIHLARFRGLSDKYFTFYKLAKKVNGDFAKLKKLSSWKYRNHYCQKQIKHMRECAIVSIETEGKWKGTPTIDELKLLVFLSSNLCKLEIENCSKIVSQNLKFIGVDSGLKIEN